jgi:hypothetical protein
MGLLLRTAAAALVFAGSVQDAAAQPSLYGDVGFNSQFVWRGVTSTNRLVVQPEMMFDVPVRSLTFTVGAWGNIEPARYDGPRDLSSLGGVPGPLITQSQLWAAMSETVAKRVDATLGVQGYLYPRIGNLADFDTVELYGNASIDAFISPAVSINCDIARVRGAYIEAGLSRAVTSERRGSVSVAVLAGFSAGQAEDPSGRDVAYFRRDGLTHIETSATASFPIGPIAISPEAHLIVAHDDLATVVAPDLTRRAKAWFGTTLRWTPSRQAR